MKEPSQMTEPSQNLKPSQASQTLNEVTFDDYRRISHQSLQKSLYDNLQKGLRSQK